jgi:chaperonin cofactor prefoldin
MGVNLSNRDGVMNIGNFNDISNNVKTVPDDDAKNKVLTLLAEMKKLAEKLEDIDADAKGSVLDDLDTLVSEVVKPDESKSEQERVAKRERVMKRIGSVLEPIKHITTVSTLLIHLNTLLPIIASLSPL